MRAMLPRLLLLLLGALLGGCGWHLAGTSGNELPLGKVFVQGGGATADAIRASLRFGSGAQLVDDPAGSELQIVVLAENVQRRVVALSGAGRIRELEIVYTVRFGVRDMQRTLIDADDIEFRTQVSYDDSSALSKEQEIAALTRDMQKDAATQIIRRTSAVRR